MYSSFILNTRQYRTDSPPNALEDMSRWQNNGVHTNVTWSRLPSRLMVRQFNGASSRVVIPHNATLNISSATGFGLEFWLNVTAFPAPGVLHYVIDKGNLAATTGWVAIIDGVNPFLQFAVGDGVSMPSTWSNVLRVNEWNHFFWTFDGRYSRCYQNGALTRNTDHGVTITVVDVVHDLYMGCRDDLTLFLNGYVDKPNMYQYVPTASYVLTQFESSRRLYAV